MLMPPGSLRHFPRSSAFFGPIPSASASTAGLKRHVHLRVAPRRVSSCRPSDVSEGVCLDRTVPALSPREHLPARERQSSFSRRAHSRRDRMEVFRQPLASDAETALHPRATHSVVLAPRRFRCGPLLWLGINASRGPSSRAGGIWASNWTPITACRPRNGLRAGRLERHARGCPEIRPEKEKADKPAFVLGGWTGFSRSPHCKDSGERDEHLSLTEYRCRLRPRCRQKTQDALKFAQRAPAHQP